MGIVATVQAESVASRRSVGQQVAKLKIPR